MNTLTAPDRASWEAIGTTAVVCVTDPHVLPCAQSLLSREIVRIDRAASNYRSDSEISKVIAAAGTRVAVSDALIEAVNVALQAAQITDGLVDPTLGHGAGWRGVLINEWSVMLPQGAYLDLGATGKALAADRAAAQIAGECPGVGVLVSLGGDIATAGPAPAGGWAVHVTDDHRASLDAPGQTVRIGSGALATSGTTVRRGSWGHHIVDPRTGLPADGPWRTVSVAAASCVDANTASTAAIVLGAEAIDWLTDQGLAARLVEHSGTVSTVGGWPSEQLVAA